MNVINRIIRISLAGFIAFSSLLVIVMPHKVLAFSGGTGTSSDPYQISTPAELASLSSYLGAGNSSKYFELINDINLDVAPYNTGSGWTPIGNSSSQFYGKFDGNGHTISGLYINRPGTQSVGLFGYVTSAGVVKDVTMADVNVTGYEFTGGLIGFYNSTSTVENIYVSGTVTGGGSSGGTGGVIGWCHSSAGTVRHSTSSADITSTNRAGGLVGYAYCPIEESAASGSVTCTTSSTTWCGGLSGTNSGGVSNSYATGAVTGPSGGGRIGGLIGGNFSTITNAYSTGLVTVPSGSNIGGLVGYLSGGSATNAFWDSQTSGQATSAGGTAKITTEMKNVATFTNTSTSTGLTTAWDFVGNPNNDAANNNYWNINSTDNDGYPFLSWQTFIYTPSVSVTSPNDASIINSWNPSVDWSDANSCEYSWDNSSWSSTNCASAGSDISAPTEGSSTLYIRANYTGETQYGVDNSSFTLDSTAPVVNAGSNHNNNASFVQSTASASDNGSGVSSYSWSKQSGPGTVTLSDASSLTSTMSADQDGTYVMRLTVLDNAGNQSQDDFTFIWDTTDPTVSITDFPDLVSNDTSPSFTFSGNDALSTPVSFSCSIDLSSSQSCTSPYNLSALTEGSHTIDIIGTDTATNDSTSQSYSWTVDTTIPVITLTGNVSETLMQGDVYMDAGATANDSLAGNLTSRIVTNNPVDVNNPGVYTITYNVEDDAGNQATAVTRTVTVLSNVDRNNDGTPDSQQANVASYINPVSGDYSVLEVPTSCSITSVSSKSEDGNTVKDPAYDYPAGLMNFTISCGTPGFSANIVQYHYGTTGDLVLRKYNPNTNAYFSITDATITKQRINNKQVIKTTYQVIDGSERDIDGLQNGTIVDPAGLAIQTVGAPNTGL